MCIKQSCDVYYNHWPETFYDVCAPFPAFASYSVSSFSPLIHRHSKDLLLFYELLFLHVRACLGFMFLINLDRLIKQLSRLFFSTVHIMCKLRISEH